MPKMMSDFFHFDEDSCHLWNYDDFGVQGRIRQVAEFMVIFMVVYQIVGESIDIKRIGRRRWWQVLKSFPAKILYKVSLITVLCIIPVRFSCSLPHFLMVDNTLSVAAVLMTTVHFLYYCRAIKFVGPFVLMVYTIITRDIIRFFMIYLIFVMGFSQAFYILFLACERKDMEILNDAKAADPLNPTLKQTEHRVNIMSNPVESILRSFIATIGEFTVLYRELSNCILPELEIMGKILFLVFEILGQHYAV
ncbi:Transient receptor potential cation channel subfamily V member 6 [Aphelenchoides bicaudatus]|nr:Transient receptor potential cation channel subfamily V member 6 [Aphelenchoides bicaudatus]